MLRLHRPLPWTFCLVVSFVSLGMFRDAGAQDFKVVTRVLQQSASSTRWENVGHSVTLFHAGKVYDRMEQVGEVVILDPTESQFVILSVTGNNLATSLHFSQLHQYLKVARSETLEHIQQLKLDGSVPARRLQALQFQLDPVFEESFDANGRTLNFSSPMLRYVVETEDPPRPMADQQYLQYADWAAKLNYVLHAGALYPDVRLAVNRSLAERKVIPTEVRLSLDGTVPVHLKAEHKFEWSLGTLDKAMIRKCEKDRTSDATRWVNFREYQRTLVTETAQR